MRGIPVWFWIPVLAIETGLISICLLSDIRGHIPETILGLQLTSIFYIFSCYAVLKKFISARRLQDRRLFAFILGAAVLFRLTVWPLYPALSDDVFRYRWEGMVQARGGNPYQARPNDPQWAGLRDSAFPMVVAKDFKAGYGPLLELLEHATYRAIVTFTTDPFVQAFWCKLPAALADLGLIAVLAALLVARGRPVEYVLVYAWCPLPVMEFWATGHNDSIAVLLVFLALWAAARERWNWAFLVLTLAAAAKLWPLLLFPALIGWHRGPIRRYQWLIAIPTALALGLPYWSAVTENARYMSGFVGGWRNNDSLFGLILWFTGGDPNHAKYIAFLLIGAVALYAVLRRLSLELACLVSITGMLMLSSNAHPWYLTWVLPLLAFYPSAWLLLWVALVPLAYQVLIPWVALGEWEHVSPWRFLIYVPVYGLLAATALTAAWRRRRNNK